jgi:hypothetical protein
MIFDIFRQKNCRKKVCDFGKKNHSNLERKNDRNVGLYVRKTPEGRFLNEFLSPQKNSRLANVGTKFAPT